MLYLVVGDIHGCVDQLREYYKLFSQVDKVIFVGDYVDRGYNSLLCLKLCMELENGITLIGNHEIKYYLRFLKGNVDYIPRDIDVSDKMKFWDTLLKLLYRYGKPKKFYKDDNIFVSHSPSFLWQHEVEEDDRMLTHGLKLDQQNNDGYKIVALPETLYNGEVSTKPIIYGHIHCPYFLIRENEYCVDFDAGKDGPLSALLFENSVVKSAYLNGKEVNIDEYILPRS